MTLGRLMLAWLPVALWFIATAAGVSRWTSADRPRPPFTACVTRAARRSALEALLLTLLASLWFDSLGAGEWWLPVGLVGALVATARIPGTLPAFLADLGRYLGAGALLAWRLKT